MLPSNKALEGTKPDYRDREAIEAINAQKRRRETWRAFAARLHQETGVKVNQGLLCAVWHGQKRSDVARLALGLAPLKKHQPIPCSDCGQFHTVAWCTEKDGEPIRPKVNNRKRAPQIRLAASVTEEEREALHALAASQGKTWTEFCKALAAGEQGE